MLDRDAMGVISKSGDTRVEYEEGYAPRRKLEIPGLVPASELKKEVPKEEAGPYKTIERQPRGEREKWDGLLRGLPVGLCLEAPKGVKAMRSIVGRFRRKECGSFEVRGHGEGSRVWRVK